MQGVAYNKEEILKVLEPFYKAGCSTKKACEYAGISDTAIYKWLTEDPELRAKVTAWKNEPNFAARKAWVDKVKGGDYQASKEWLERVEKDDFSTRTEQTGRDGKDLLPIPIMDIKNVRQNNSDRENNTIEGTVENSAGGDISLKDNINTPLLDSIRTDRQEPNVNEHSIREYTPLEEGSNEGLQADNGSTELLEQS